MQDVLVVRHWPLTQRKTFAQVVLHCVTSGIPVNSSDSDGLPDTAVVADAAWHLISKIDL